MTGIEGKRGRSHWTSLALGRIYRRHEHRGAAHMPMLSVYRDHGVVLRDSREDNHNRPGEDLDSYKVVAPGDLVINKMKTWQGSLGVSALDGIVSPAYLVARRVGNADDRFMHHLLRSQSLIAEYGARSKGIRPAQWDLPWDEFAAIKVRLPPMPQQRRIADYLDVEVGRIDELIAVKQEIVGLVSERAVEQQRTEILRGLDPTSGSGSLPNGWRTSRLGILILLQRGHDLPADSRRDGDVPIVSSGGVSGFHDTPAAKGPGVVTGRYGTIGGVTFVEKDYWPLNTTLYVRDFRGTEPRWIRWLLSVLPLDIESAKTAVTGINRNIIGQLFVPVPPPEEQRRIADVLDDLDRKVEDVKSTLNEQIALLQERRRSLITAVVTGEMEVP